MSLGSEASNLLNPPKFASATDKLAWRKDVRYWAMNLNACVDGGDSRAKGAKCAMAMILFRSLPVAKRQTLEKLVDTGELSLDAGADFEAQNAAIELIISVVAKDSASESIQRLARLARDAVS